MGFKKIARPLFVDLHTPSNNDTDALFNIILSPSFYWVKRVSLPVQSLREVKKLLPSLFEDTVPKGAYNYYAYEDDDAYLVFAYDDKKILDLLTERGITPDQINEVYFAQSEFQDIDQAVSIDEKCALDLQDRVVVKLPGTLIENSTPLQLQEHTFSEHALELARYAHIATTKTVIRFAVITGTLILIFALDWIVSLSKIAEFDDSHLALYKERHLPATKVQNEAILASLKKEYNQQIKMRKLTDKVLHINLQKNEYITLYDLQGKKLVVELRVASSKRASEVIKALKKHSLSFKDNFDKSKLRLEFTL